MVRWSDETVAALLRDIDRLLARPSRDAVIEGVKRVTKRLGEMHDSCLAKADLINRGATKSIVGSQHYIDQAIGISHALDLLNGSDMTAVLATTTPRSTRAEGGERAPAATVKCDCGIDCEDLGAAGGCRYLPREHMKEKG